MIQNAVILSTGDEITTGKVVDTNANYLADKLAEIDAAILDLAREWDAALDAHAPDDKKSAILGRFNEILNRRAYIRNLVSGVQRELAEA